MKINIKTNQLIQMAQIVQDQNPEFADNLRTAYLEAQMPEYKTQIEYMPIDITDKNKDSYKAAWKQLQTN